MVSITIGSFQQDITNCVASTAMHFSRWWRLGWRRSGCPVRAWREPASHCTPAWQRAQKGASWASFPGPLLTEALLPFMRTYHRPNSCPRPHLLMPPHRKDGLPLRQPQEVTGKQSTVPGEMSQHFWGFGKGCWCS